MSWTLSFCSYYHNQPCSFTTTKLWQNDFKWCFAAGSSSHYQPEQDASIQLFDSHCLTADCFAGQSSGSGKMLSDNWQCWKGMCPWTTVFVVIIFLAENECLWILMPSDHFPETYLLRLNSKDLANLMIAFLLDFLLRVSGAASGSVGSIFVDALDELLSSTR